MKKRLRSLEHQVRLLEQLIGKLDQQLTEATAGREQRDQLLGEMLQLLKENLDGRVKMTGRFYQLREKYLARTQEPSPQPQPSLISRLRKKG